MNRFPIGLSIAVALCVVLSVAPKASAQMPPSSSTTSTPIPGAGHNYLGEIAETVNPVNGSVSIRLNAMMPPGRGLTLPFSFAYDSNGVNYVGQNSGGNLFLEARCSDDEQKAGYSKCFLFRTRNSVPPIEGTPVKNVQIIDGAVNATYSIFQATEEEFEVIFPQLGQDIEIVEDYVGRVGENEATRTLSKLWDRPVHKRDVEGIHGTLYYGYREKSKYLPKSKREMDRNEGQLNKAERALYARLRSGDPERL